MASISAAAFATPTYSLVDIGTLSGDQLSTACAINNAGTVVGQSYKLSHDNPSVFTYHNGTLTNAFPYSGTTTALAVNSSGLLVGSSNILAGVMHAVTVNNGIATDLGSLIGPDATSYGAGVNDAGLVVGWSQVRGESSGHAFLYDGTMHDLGANGGFASLATDINNQGTVVGNLQEADFSIHAFFYKNGTMTTIVVPGEDHSGASAINDLGQIVGTTAVPGGQNRAFSYLNGVVTNLGTLGGDFSAAEGLNLGGDVVGVAKNSLGQPCGFLYTGGTMLDLNGIVDSTAAGFRISDATGINDSGWIAANAELADGSYHAVLLRPQAVPEPASLIALSLGSATFLRRRRKA